MKRIIFFIVSFLCIFQISTAQSFPYFSITINNSVTIYSNKGYFTNCVGDTLKIKSFTDGADISEWNYKVVSYDSILFNNFDSTLYSTPEFEFVIDTTSYFFISMSAIDKATGGSYDQGIDFRAFYCPPTAAFTVSDSVVCQNNCITATDKSSRKPTAWAWDMPGATPNSYSGADVLPICFTDTGLHTISLVATNPGGSDTATQNIYVRPAPLPKYVQTEFTISYGDSLTLQACASGEQYIWQGCANCDSTYTLTPTTKNTTVTGTVRTLPSCDVACTYTILTTGIPEEVMIPTAFSPNGDGINDGFGIAELSPYRRLNAFSIYNRWGELVFSTKVQDDRWNGIYKDMAQPLGTYVWYIDMTNTLTGSRKTLQGNVTLVR